MSIYKGSRYAGVKFTAVKHGDGSVKTFLHSRKPLTTSDMRPPLYAFRVMQTDVIDMLAKSLGGDQKKWWVIADINDIMFPLDLTDEREIYVPDRGEFYRNGK